MAQSHVDHINFSMEGFSMYNRGTRYTRYCKLPGLLKHFARRLNQDHASCFLFSLLKGITSDCASLVCSLLRVWDHTGVHPWPLGSYRRTINWPPSYNVPWRGACWTLLKDFFFFNIVFEEANYLPLLLVATKNLSSFTDDYSSVPLIGQIPRPRSGSCRQRRKSEEAAVHIMWWHMARWHQ